MTHSGFTLIEILMIVMIVAVLAALAVPAFHNFQLTSNLDNTAEEIINALRLAQSKTIASDDASAWGVYFYTGALPHQYILFKGESYASREVSADIVNKIPGAVLISEVNLGAGSEAVFSRVSGYSRQSGSVKLALKTDSSRYKIVYIEDSGQIGLTAPVVPSDISRVKDSRHIHVDYSRHISTTTESLVLTFSYDAFTVTETIPIAGNMKYGQIYWEGQVDAGGQVQKLKIHTHQLNDPFSGTSFSVHRDGRYNTRAMKIDIDDSPDPDAGTIIEYSADGLTTVNTSIYASGIQWQ